MTVQFFSAPLNYQFLFTESQQRSSPRSNKKRKNRQSNDSPKSSEATSETALWAALLAAIPIGVMVLTDLLRLVYCNEQARALCDRLQKDNAVPDLVCELCQRLIAEEVVIPEPLIMEYQGATDQVFRLQVRWMELSDRAFLVVLLEDCQVLLQDELKIEQAKYDLTVREAEVWCLLRQKYSYQEISELLRITLNTVKTHAKNIYAKRKNLAGEQKIWYSR